MAGATEHARPRAGGPSGLVAHARTAGAAGTIGGGILPGEPVMPPTPPLWAGSLGGLLAAHAVSPARRSSTVSFFIWVSCPLITLG
ncbi:hypothetical protein RAA17_00885 [Komagataeibacter rhaeticus]|nr:hypothetical protein [Komagataeibacter rhaeticus]